MKHLLLAIPLFLFFPDLKGQDEKDKTIYYNKDWKECLKDEASYYRVIEDYYSKKEIYKVTDYYITGEKQMEGSYIEPDMEYSKNGTFIWYYKNGNKNIEANYFKNVRHGKYSSWYEDGTRQIVGKYLVNETDEKLPGTLEVTSFWDSTGVQLVTNGYGKYFEYDEDESFGTGMLVKGLKDGKWTGHSRSLNIEYEEEYKKGKLLEGKSMDSNGKVYFYEQIRVRPSPDPDFTAFYRHVRSNLSYPRRAQLNDVEGTVYVQFVVNEDGYITDTKIYRSVGYGCDAEALRVIGLSPKWNPGMVRGVRTKMLMTLPVVFKLT